MRSHVLAFLSTAVGLVASQAVTEKIAPAATPSADAGCRSDIDGKFEIAVVDLNNKAKRDELTLQKRATCSDNGVLLSELHDGVITDSAGRTGYIAANYQFQFDKPPQAGAIYTAGFYQCANGSLALGDSAVFYQCRSGDFYNLYDRWWAEQCSPVEILVLPCGGEEVAVPEGRTIGSDIVTTTIVKPLSDGQPQVITTTVPIAICQIGDGQVQGHTTPCAALTTPPASGENVSVPPVSQLSDGQIQVTQLSDGQIQVTPHASGSAGGPPPAATGGATFKTPAGAEPTPPTVPTGAPGTSAANRGVKVAGGLLAVAVAAVCAL
ncbi:hypothetical protein QBC35DRAFT_67786 [Podospora australis]|uniref:Cell wall mannoprotein PIR1-like C-terminal domain-containing protein n=1 Tax=Podospora australis TaxID=1536484 RepID=A0AAN7AFP0_9PEZI|nr:hypothetical protein QBC35DRAFT_67786 [Podospora australis]